MRLLVILAVFAGASAHAGLLRDTQQDGKLADMIAAEYVDAVAPDFSSKSKDCRVSSSEDFTP